ncbi:hypothetical protein DM02DRAFT_86154 [Periconia macrospinosa]|uniref:Uncharacterized protein n=1 Tax=Periconia macrospinosa TaxID=97972 RepID=A0A2V1DI79_9PLEO|nr:hypothetical protein DM02DRAFT_86154 [Periconia macrospinosa]
MVRRGKGVSNYRKRKTLYEKEIQMQFETTFKIWRDKKKPPTFCSHDFCCPTKSIDLTVFFFFFFFFFLEERLSPRLLSETCTACALHANLYPFPLVLRLDLENHRPRARPSSTKRTRNKKRLMIVPLLNFG